MPCLALNFSEEMNSMNPWTVLRTAKKSKAESINTHSTFYVLLKKSVLMCGTITICTRIFSFSTSKPFQ